MTTTTPSAVLVPVQPLSADAGRLTLAGFLAGYRGLTLDAYVLGLRQFTTWCRTRSVPLFAVRRAGPPGRSPPARRTWPTHELLRRTEPPLCPTQKAAEILSRSAP